MKRRLTSLQFARKSSGSGVAGPGRCQAGCGFTLLELILTMALLTIVISLSAPALASFFRGRSLDSEARRLLALTREGQSRAISEGVPMELWIDSDRNRFGLEAEPTYEDEDPRAMEFDLSPEMTLETINAAGSRNPLARSEALILSSEAAKTSRHSHLPRVRFLPDGSIDLSSPAGLCLTDQDGFAIRLVQTRNRLRYEIESSAN